MPAACFNTPADVLDVEELPSLLLDLPRCCPGGFGIASCTGPPFAAGELIWFELHTRLSFSGWGGMIAPVGLVYGLCLSVVQVKKISSHF